MRRKRSGGEYPGLCLGLLRIMLTDHFLFVHKHRLRFGSINTSVMLSEAQSKTYPQGDVLETSIRVHAFERHRH